MVFKSRVEGLRSLGSVFGAGSRTRLGLRVRGLGFRGLGFIEFRDLAPITRPFGHLEV